MEQASSDERKAEFGLRVLPCPEPWGAAVDAGVFGFDEHGVIVPSVEDVRALTEEHARELLALLNELNHLQDCALHVVDPVSGRAPRGRDRREALVERLARESEKLRQHYDDALAAYADGFGWEAADALDGFVKEVKGHALPESRPLVQQEMF